MFRRRSRPARTAGLGWPVRLFAAGPVGGALILSFANLADLARASRIEGWLAYVWPITLDATGVVATLIWLNPRMPDDARRSAMRLALAAITVSILGNSLMHWLLDSGQRPHVSIQMIVAAVPPSVLFMMLHVLHLCARPRPASQPVASLAEQPAVTASQPDQPADPDRIGDLEPVDDIGAPAGPITATAARTDQSSQPGQPALALLPGQRPASQPATGQPAARHRAASWRTHIPAAREIVAGQPDIGRPALAERLDIPESQARKLLAHLATTPIPQTPAGPDGEA